MDHKEKTNNVNKPTDEINQEEDSSSSSKEQPPPEQKHEPSSSLDEEDQKEVSSPPEDRLKETVPTEQQGPLFTNRVTSNHSDLKMNEVSICSGKSSETSLMTGPRGSRDASTNTPLIISSRKVIEDQLSAIREDQVEDKKFPYWINGLIDCHTRALGKLPILHKFLFFVPIRYGVYTVISCEEIYFFLRSYSRVLHLAMPYFFPDLTRWLATTELLLCLGILVSDLFLLYGVFINPTYLFFWIDIHLLEMLIYFFLILWLPIYGLEPLYQFPLLFSAYILCFTYSISIVNSYRMLWNTARAYSSEVCPPFQEKQV